MLARSSWYAQQVAYYVLLFIYYRCNIHQLTLINWNFVVYLQNIFKPAKYQNIKMPIQIFFIFLKLEKKTIWEECHFLINHHRQKMAKAQKWYIVIILIIRSLRTISKLSRRLLDSKQIFKYNKWVLKVRWNNKKVFIISLYSIFILWIH